LLARKPTIDVMRDGPIVCIAIKSVVRLPDGSFVDTEAENQEKVRASVLVTKLRPANNEGERRSWVECGLSR
jgi:hypothetical protein